MTYHADATPTKLFDGSWGATVHTSSPIQVGDEIKIVARSGKTWKTGVAEIIAEKRGRTIVRTGAEVLKNQEPEEKPQLSATDEERNEEEELAELGKRYEELKAAGKIGRGGVIIED